MNRKVRYGGKIWEVHTFTRPVANSERGNTERVSANIFGIIASFFTTGTRQGLVFNKELHTSIVEDDYNSLGFHPNDRESLRKYMAANAQRAICRGDHRYVTVRLPRSGLTGFVFVPYGNTAKIKYISAYNIDRLAHTYTDRELHNVAQRVCQNYRGNSKRFVVRKALVGPLVTIVGVGAIDTLQL